MDALKIVLLKLVGYAVEMEFSRHALQTVAIIDVVAMAYVMEVPV